MADFFWMKVKRIGVVAAVSAISLTANAESVERGPAFSPATDWVLIKREQLGNLTAERQLGDYFVVKQSEAKTLKMPAQAAKQGLTLMEAGPGVFAISDASAIVIAYNARLLDELILDYNLTATHLFTATPAAVIQFAGVDSAEQALATLRNDMRVKAAELNLQTFADKPQ